MHPAAEALIAHRGDVGAVAEQLGMTRRAVYQVAHRAGLSVTALRYGAQPLPERAAPPSVTGDEVPFAEPVLAATLVDNAALAMAVQEKADELEQSHRIIATLIRELERVGHG